MRACVCVCAYVCAIMYVQVCVCVCMSSFCCFSVEEMFCICAFDSVVLSVLPIFFSLIFLSYHLSLFTVWKYLLCACVCVCLFLSFCVRILEVLNLDLTSTLFLADHIIFIRIANLNNEICMLTQGQMQTV